MRRAFLVLPLILFAQLIFAGQSVQAQPGVS